MLFTKHKHSFVVSEVILGNTVLTRVSVTKFLGVEIDDKLSWKYHICSVVKKLSQYTGILSKIIYKINSDTALLLYNIMFQPHIHYCNLIWANTYKSALSPIIVLQKRAIRMCLKIKMTHDEPNVFHLAKLLSVTDLNTLLTLKFIFSWFFNLLPHSFDSIFTLTDSMHQHATRNSDCNNLFINPCHTNLRKFSLKIRGPQLWNKLPNNIKLLNSEYLFSKSCLELITSDQNPYLNLD